MVPLRRRPSGLLLSGHTASRGLDGVADWPDFQARAVVRSAAARRLHREGHAGSALHRGSGVARGVGSMLKGQARMLYWVDNVGP